MDAERVHQSLGFAGTELIECTVLAALSEADVLAQLGAMHPLFLWELFKMDVTQDADIGGWEGWYEHGGNTFYAHAETRYSMNISVR